MSRSNACKWPFLGDNTTSWETDDKEKVVIPAVNIVAPTATYISREPCRTSVLSGSKYVDGVLNGNNGRCCESFRMDKQVFWKLCDNLQAKGLLSHTSEIRIEEKLAIFLFLIGHNQPYQAVEDLFQRSEETINYHFEEVLKAILALSANLIRPPGSDIPSEILDNPKFYPYFKNCVGAINVAQFPVMDDPNLQGPWHSKNESISQKVLAACSFDLQFQYVVAGWEGTATGSLVLDSALTNCVGQSQLKVPISKYYLVDATHANRPRFIAPYRGVRYHLSDFPDSCPPENAKELFNYRLSLLQNATKRNFEVLKERFPILNSPVKTQVKVVVAACEIHNHIQKDERNQLLNKQKFPLQIEKPVIKVESQASEATSESEQRAIASQLWDSIATAMWNDHKHV